MALLVRSQLIVSQFDTEEVNVTLPGGDGNDRAFEVRRGWWEREEQGLDGKEGVVGTGRTGP